MTPEIRNLKIEKAIIIDKLSRSYSNEALLRLGEVVFQIFVLEKENLKTCKNIFDES